jgi:hypothetical protein
LFLNDGERTTGGERVGTSYKPVLKDPLINGLSLEDYFDKQKSHDKT